MTTKIPLKNDDLVVPGDKLELSYKLAGPLFMRAAISALIEDRLAEKFTNFRVDSYTWKDDKFFVYVTVIEPEQKTPPVYEANAVAVVAISAAILGVALVYWFTQDTTYKIVETATPAISLLAIALILYFTFRLFGHSDCSPVCERMSG